jgi:hypothetical protein
VTTRPEVGTAAEEAVRLFAVVAEWARTHGSGLLDEDHLATGSPECRLCPLCQAIGAARDVRPEAVEHLLDAAASFVAALRASVAPPSGGGAARRTAGVEHIDVRED